MRTSLFVSLLFLFPSAIVGCHESSSGEGAGREAPPTFRPSVAPPTEPASATVLPSASSPTGAAETDPLARADAAAARLGKTLRSKLEEAQKTRGNAAAIEACAGEAQQVVAEIGKDTGVKVGRSSLRLRSPKDAPPTWVAEWLKAQGAGSGGTTGVRALVETPKGKVARVIRPIRIETPCLGCHGDTSGFIPEVRAVLAAKYPSDHATGYQLGDLRGALWAELPIAK
jgi:hypothetical protein